jgi:NAD(P)-dependent dehydrogenase (short-subunit alcohol dehydrogenase family)
MIGRPLSVLQAAEKQIRYSSGRVIGIGGMRNYWSDHIPAGRIGRIEEIAQAALFLNGDHIGDFAVGGSLIVDGGQ